MPTPLVSVIMPLYNREAYVADALASVLNQTMGDFELLVLDDGSTDGSHAIAKRYAESDPRMVLWRQENRGMVSTLNILAEKAQGQFLATFDSDDRMLPERLAWGVQDLTEHPEALAAFCMAETIDERGHIIDRHLQPAEPVNLDGRQVAERLVVANCLCSSASFLRRSALDPSVPFMKPLTRVNDWELWLRLASRGDVLRRKNFGVQWRRHGDNMSSKDPEDAMRQALWAQELHAEKVIKHHALDDQVWMRIHAQRARHNMRLGNLNQAMVHLCTKKKYDSLTAEEAIWLVHCFMATGRGAAASQLTALLSSQVRHMDLGSMLAVEQLSQVMGHNFPPKLMPAPTPGAPN